MRLFPIFLVIVLSASMVLGDKGVLGITKPGPIDRECQVNGFEYGIVKFEWAGSGFLPEGSPEGISVWGDTNTAYWNSTYPVAGVIHKEALDTYVHSGGYSGTIHYNGFGISHITFCGDKDADIPEFSLVGGLIVLALAGAFILRKR